MVGNETITGKNAARVLQEEQYESHQLEIQPALLQSAMVVNRLQRALHIKNSVKCGKGEG